MLDRLPQWPEPRRAETLAALRAEFGLGEEDRVALTICLLLCQFRSENWLYVIHAPVSAPPKMSRLQCRLRLDEANPEMRRMIASCEGQGRPHLPLALRYAMSGNGS